ncbi:RNA polymerase sigma factor [Pleionea sp. CnH1-48]|uniref:RNA polymerase sigma factor n=1 Tax=Pleionea sp. CnH1-48 TaxID=2954494 RepID=UPI00209748CB|nr:RNA polymerase sigma factor [Pleionea sp. CnH1-48]MCO7222826.1 RNA polymerase sigma factor [Pleionea sp. CnH1-48]
MTPPALTHAFDGDYNKASPIQRRQVLEQRQQLDNFLASVERKAFRIAQISTHNVDDSLELVQEAMMKLVERYSDKPENEWPPLFYRILNSKINDWHRRQKVRNRWMIWPSFRQQNDDTNDYNLVESAPDSSQAPFENMVSSQATDALIALLHQLSPRQQQAFILRAWEGFDVAETAYAMGCSEGSVKTHYSRAIHFLKDNMQTFDG